MLFVAKAAKTKIIESIGDRFRCCKGSVFKENPVGFYPVFSHFALLLFHCEFS